MRTAAADPRPKLVGAIDHAAHSLALARESLPPESAGSASPKGAPVQARVRAEVGRVARLLDEAREPGRVTPESIEGAAYALDRQLDLLGGGKRAGVVPKLIETRLEERDGGTWVTGLCPFCWERIAVLTDADEGATSARCSNGHELTIVELRSAGAS